MRILLTLMAVLGLLLGPVSAAAAQSACARAENSAGSMASMQMSASSMQTIGHKATISGVGRSEHGKKADLSCHQLCGLMTSALLALPSTSPVPIFIPQAIERNLTKQASVSPSEPGNLERPPRSII